MKAKIYMLMLALTSMLVSCRDKEDIEPIREERHYHINLVGEGFDFAGENGLYEIHIPSGGGEFSVVPQELYSDKAYVSSILICYVEEAFSDVRERIPDASDFPYIKREWGEISYDFSINPLAILFKVNENDRDMTRGIAAFIGTPFYSAKIFIFQAPADSDIQQK